MNHISRRQFMAGLSGLSMLPSYLRAQMTSPNQRPIERVIFIYHPDGAFYDQWHLDQPAGPIREWSVSLAPLAKFRQQTILLRRLNILDGRGDGHPEPASMLLCGPKNQYFGSLDVQLSEYYEKPLIHLGVHASKYNGESISYLPGGSQKLADDSPLSAAKRLLGYDGSTTSGVPNDRVLDELELELEDLLKSLPQKEQIKLNQHLSQLKTLRSNSRQCEVSDLALGDYNEDMKYQDKNVPLIMDLQTEILVQSLYCGQSPVATLQFSRNTSPMKLDFDFLDGWQGRYAMESHQASHNDAEIHAQQKRWINMKIANLLTRLSEIAEPNLSKSGSMLDHSLVVVLTEVGNGAAHTRYDMPYYIVGGRGSGLLRNGEVVDCRDASHSQLLYSIAELLGMPAREPYRYAGPLASIFRG